ncbi:MAG: NAD-dependent epimerase/dehydratase family protein [Planctomycetota bacterium]
MRKPAILITGAGGEVGFGLIDGFQRDHDTQVVSLDLKEIPKSLREKCDASIVGDILDENLLQRLVTEYEIHAIYHLAALLSTRAEYTPETAHRVNVEGTLNLLKLAHEQSRWHGHPVKFVFPSSIAVYGLPSAEAKRKAGKVNETEWVFPTTMYGCNKSYCEQLGRYYALHYRQLAAEAGPSGVDFRSVRFPGLISAITMPSGGTSDYAVEMIHAAAQKKPYACFVTPEARIPFMVMPDAIKALQLLAEAPANGLAQQVYNVTSFSLSAAELRERVLRAFPNAKIAFELDVARARIVDSWPQDVDDAPARRDWGWQPDYDADRAFRDYLVPEISRHYAEPR